VHKTPAPSSIAFRPMDVFTDCLQFEARLYQLQSSTSQRPPALHPNSASFASINSRVNQRESFAR